MAEKNIVKEKDPNKWKYRKFFCVHGVSKHHGTMKDK